MPWTCVSIRASTLVLLSTGMLTQLFDMSRRGLRRDIFVSYTTDISTEPAIVVALGLALRDFSLLPRQLDPQTHEVSYPNR